MIDPWLDATPNQIAYTLMADSGGVYAWIRYVDEPATLLGRHCGDAGSGWFGEHRISPDLELALAAWQRAFEKALLEEREPGDGFDWPAFHGQGIELACQLKREIRTRARVIYQKAVQDPRHRALERQEVSLDGTLVRLPNRAQLELLPLRQLVRRIVSGGQTGVDRAALDWALASGVAHGGWCPRGRRAEDGPIAERYALLETESASYAERTRRNVREADATLILTVGPLAGGTLLTQRVATAAGKPCLVTRLDSPYAQGEAQRILEWLGADALLVLNVAGPREQSRPGVHALASAMMRRLDREAQRAFAPA